VVLPDKLTMALVYSPVPVPSLVLLLSIVGLGAVFQHTPFAVIDEPSLLLMTPPELAVLGMMLTTVEVVRTGTLFFLQAVPMHKNVISTAHRTFTAIFFGMGLKFLQMYV
jgi:hypothetical protein